MRLLKTKKNFRSELKRQIKWAIAAAVGFLIAFAWRDAIIEGSREIVKKITESTQAITIDIFNALVITVIGVGIILLSSKLLKDR